MPRGLIEASLSEPHINGTAVCVSVGRPHSQYIQNISCNIAACCNVCVLHISTLGVWHDVAWPRPRASIDHATMSSGVRNEPAMYPSRQNKVNW